MQTAKLNNLVLYVLVVCALVTTGLVVRREVMSPAPPTVVAIPSEPVFRKDWQDTLPHGIRIGSARAPVQLVEFADFQCPYCARFEKRLSEVAQRYGDKMAVTFVHSPLPNHAQAEHAARAAECADAQGQFAAMKAVLFENQAVLGTIPWVELGRLAKLRDVDRFQACVESTQPVARLIHGKLLTTRFEVRGTPTILLNGWVLPRPPSTDELDRMVRDMLNGKTPKLR